MKQMSFEKVNGWGGKRRGAGRKKTSGKITHAKREKISIRNPLHLTLKFRPGIYLRTGDCLLAFRAAAVAAKKFSLHIIHYSIENEHIHIIAEAKDNECLAAGMKSLCGRLGRSIRAMIGGHGPVFLDRYHVRVIRNPTQMRRTLEYVLLNTAKHMNTIAHIDSFCSGFAFNQWRELLGRHFCGLIRDQVEDFSRDLTELSRPQSWLCNVGWLRAG